MSVVSCNDLPELAVQYAGNFDRAKKGLGEKGNRVEGFATDNGPLTTDAQVPFLLAINTAAILLPIKI